MSTDFPTSKQTFTNPTINDKLNSPSHSGQHADVNDTVEAVQDKIGTGASTPTIGLVLTGTGTGTSSWQAASGGDTFWNDVPGTPTRVSDTQFTITDTNNDDNYDSLFKKGVVLKWLESTTFQTAMVISSSYSSNDVTINIVGNTLTAGFTEMKYAANEIKEEVFIIPGVFGTGTDLAKTWYTREQLYLISADAYAKTAPTGATAIFDINDDGSTLFTTKPTIAISGTSDLDNVSDNPATAVAKDSLITIDIDQIGSTIAGADAYIKVFHYPVSWRYR